MGYGSRALRALNEFYSGECLSVDESTRTERLYPDASAIDPVRLFLCTLIYVPHDHGAQSTTLRTDLPTVRHVNAMPPLLQRLSERKPEALDYLGVSYGLTPQLLR